MLVKLEISKTLYQIKPSQTVFPNKPTFFLNAWLIFLGFFTGLRGLYLEGLIHGRRGGGRRVEVIFGILQY